MSGKRRHNEREARKETARRQAKLDALARGDGVNESALAPHGSYSQPDFVERGYYVDKPFVCEECGTSQVWTAGQQKWWYEVAKGYVFSTAKLCRLCRKQARAPETESGPGRGDPNPYKNAGLLLAKIRSDLEPKLLAAGYHPVGRNRQGSRRALFIDYGRSDDLFTLSWTQHEVPLAAQLLTDSGALLRDIAAVEFSGVRSTSEIANRLAPFVESVKSFLDGLRKAPPEAESRPGD
jgi:hypothetical protein